MIDIKKVQLSEGEFLVSPYDFNKEEKESGFVMPNTVKFENPNYGTVICLPKEYQDVEVNKTIGQDVYYGDVIVFDKQDALDVSMSEEEKFYIVNEFGVKGVIKLDK